MDFDIVYPDNAKEAYVIGNELYALLQQRMQKKFGVTLDESDECEWNDFIHDFILSRIDDDDDDDDDDDNE